MKTAKRWITVLLLALLIQPGQVLAESVSTVSAGEEQTESTEEESQEDTTGAISATKGNITTDDFEIRVVCGLEGNYRNGAALPVTIYIESKNEDFEGVVRIIAPGNTDMGYPAAAYEKDILLTAGTQKVVTMSVYDDSSSTLLYFQLDDAKGKQLIDQKILMTSKQNSNALVGVLSDDYTALNYFDKTTIFLTTSSYDGNAQLVELDESTLPDQPSGLDALSYLIINSFDTSRLSGEQVKAIEDWVQQGGVLIIGAGADYQQTLSAFDKLVSVKSDGMTSGSLQLTNKEGKELKFSEKDGILALSLEEGENLTGILSQKDLIWKEPCGNGCIVVTAMNLGMEPVSSWESKQDFAQMLLVKAAETGSCAERICNLNYGGESDMWALTEALDSLIETKMPNFLMIAVILLLFVLAGPILYLILKAVDHRGFLWVVIPALAICFTVVIFISTMNIRIRNPQEASITVLYDDAASEEGLQQEVSMSILVPTAKKVNVNLTDTLASLRLYSDWNDYYYSTGNSESQKVEYKTAIREGAQGYQLGIENKETFGSVYLGMKNNVEPDCGTGFTTDFKRTITGVSGSVTNNTGKDLEGVVVFVPSFMVSIGNLKDGETKEFSETDNELFDSEYFYDIMIPGMDTEDPRYYQLCNVYQMIYSNYMYGDLDSGDSNDAYVMGYLDSWDADYVKDEKVKEFNKAVLVRHEELSFADYKDAKMLSLFEFATIMEDWDSYDGMLYANSAEEEFDLKNVVGDIYAFVRAGNSIYGSSSNVKIYAWNCNTETYDEIFTDDKKVEKIDKDCPYLDENGKIKMKFTGQSAYSDCVPSISVVCSEPQSEMGGEE